MGLPRSLSRSAAIVAALALALAGVAAAQAHVQVRPAEAAPEDPVLWTVLVPNEKEVGTTRVELKIPEGVTPFSFLDVPGWKRTEQLAPNGALDTVTWTGKLADDGLAEFRFLATTPAQPGPIAWRALQTYADGSVVRWIGDQQSEEPASITRIATDAPRENAGGEGLQGGDPGPTAPEPVASIAATPDEGDDWLARGLALGGLLLSLALLVVAIRRRPTKSGHGDAW